jgi:predicted RND superfamily exporter protein
VITTAAKAAARRLVAWPIDRPRTVLAVAGLLSLLAAFSASRIHRSNSLHDLLGDRSAAATALQRVMDRFAVVDELLVLVTDEDRTARPPEEESASRLLVFAQELEAAVATSPGARALCARIRHGADAEMMDFIRDVLAPAGVLYLGDREFESLRSRLTPEAMKEQLRQDEAMLATPGPAGALAKPLLRDPLRLREFLAGRLSSQQSIARTWRGRPEFISPDGRSLLIRVSGVRPASDLQFCTLLTGQIQRIVEQVATPGLRIELSGPYAIAATSAASIRRDSIINIVSAVVLMQVLFLFSYRRLWSFPLAILPVALGILLSLGIFGLFGHRLTPLTAVIAAMLAGLGIDYSIHYLSHFDTVASQTPDPREAARRTLAEIGLPLFAAGLTSVHGFIAIAFSGATALRDFALLGAVGLACSLLASILILPALLRATEGLRARATGPGAPRFSLRFMIDAIARRARSSVTLAGAALVAMTAVVVLRGLPLLETDLSAMHPRPNPPLEAQRRAAQLFGGIADPLLIHLTADSPDELVARAHAIDRALHSAQASPAGVSATFGLATLLPDPAARPALAARFALLDPDRIVADFTAAVQESLFDPAGFREYSEFLRTLTTAREPPGLDSLERYPSLAETSLAPPEPAAAPGTGGARRREAVTYVFFDHSLDERAQRDGAVLTIRSLLAGVPGATLTGVTVVAYDVERLIRRDIPRVVAICGAAVLLTVIVLFRRPADVGLILLPVWWSVASVLAYMTLAGERINLANLVAMPLLLGICVDYGIFAVGLARVARREHRAGREGDDGLAGRLGASGHAMLMTSTTTIIGFGTLITTSTPAIQSLGRLVAVGVGACLIGTLFLLAPILIILHRKSPGGPHA